MNAAYTTPTIERDPFAEARAQLDTIELSVSRLMGPAIDKIASLMGPADRQGHGATRKVADPVFARVMGPADRQGHGATPSLAS